MCCLESVLALPFQFKPRWKTTNESLHDFSNTNMTTSMSEGKNFTFLDWPYNCISEESFWHDHPLRLQSSWMGCRWTLLGINCYTWKVFVWKGSPVLLTKVLVQLDVLPMLLGRRLRMSTFGASCKLKVSIRSLFDGKKSRCETCVMNKMDWLLWW